MKETVKSFREKNILVIGDSILDITINSEAIGLSLESPTLKAKETNKEYSFGGAYNVVKNIIALGAKCTFATLIGDDEYKTILESYKHPNLNFIPLNEKKYINIVKSRFWVGRGDGRYKYFQLNRSGPPVLLSAENEEKLFFQIRAKPYDKIILVDYRGGLLTKKNVKMIMNEASAPIIASSQTSDRIANHHMYSGANLICMNSDEFDTNCKIHNVIDVELQETFNSNICVTRGAQGSTLLLNREMYNIDTIKTEAKDSCGAGDSFLAMLSLTDYTKKPEVSLKLSNIWAALTVKHLGTKTPDYENFLEHVKQVS